MSEERVLPEHGRSALHTQEKAQTDLRRDLRVGFSPVTTTLDDLLLGL